MADLQAAVQAAVEVMRNRFVPGDLTAVARIDRLVAEHLW